MVAAPSSGRCPPAGAAPSPSRRSRVSPRPWLRVGASLWLRGPGSAASPIPEGRGAHLSGLRFVAEAGDRRVGAARGAGLEADRPPGSPGGVAGWAERPGREAGGGAMRCDGAYGSHPSYPAIKSKERSSHQRAKAASEVHSSAARSLVFRAGRWMTRAFPQRTRGRDPQARGGALSLLRVRPGRSLSASRRSARSKDFNGAEPPARQDLVAQW